MRLRVSHQVGHREVLHLLGRPRQDFIHLCEREAEGGLGELGATSRCGDCLPTNACAPAPPRTCMQMGSQSWPNRMTTTRSSSDRMAWSVA
jgi:hypothetical protein